MRPMDAAAERVDLCGVDVAGRIQLHPVAKLEMKNCSEGSLESSANHIFRQVQAWGAHSSRWPSRTGHVLTLPPGEIPVSSPALAEPHSRRPFYVTNNGEDKAVREMMA